MSFATTHSHEEYFGIIAALAAYDEERAAQPMQSHLLPVEEGLAFDHKRPINDLSIALSAIYP
ncbi:MAG: hypothetical protein WAN92_01910 [Herbaspirillum sp.]